MCCNSSKILLYFSWEQLLGDVVLETLSWKRESSFVFCKELPREREPDKTAQAGEKFSVKEGWREKQRWRLSAREKVKAYKERFCYQLRSKESKWKVRTPRERERQKKKWDQYIPAAACIFVSALRLSLEYQWRLNHSDGNVKNKKNAVGKGRGKGLNRQKRATTDLKKRKEDQTGRWGKLITAWETERPQKWVAKQQYKMESCDTWEDWQKQSNWKWVRGSLTNGKTKKWVSDQRDERFEKRREINEEVEWPVLRERRSSDQNWYERERDACLVLIQRDGVMSLSSNDTSTDGRWSQSLQLYLRLEKCFSIFQFAILSLFRSLCVFISQSVSLSVALFSLFAVRIDVWWKACLD